ncbi:MAG: hypothetical protein ACRC46_04995 [Thermoguttaceae bacterium]
MRRFLICVCLCFVVFSRLVLAAENVVRSPEFDVAVRFDVVPSAPRLSDDVTVSWEVVPATGVVDEQPEFGDTFGDFDVVRKRRHAVVLRPQRVGTLRLLPIPITLRRGETTSVVTIPATLLEVTSPVDGSLDAISSPTLPLVARSWWPLIALGVVVVLIVSSVVYLRRRARSTLPVVVLTSQEAALAGLDDLIARRVYASDVYLFYHEMSRLVRIYIEATTPIRAMEATTSELMSHFSAHHGASDKLRRFLVAADLVKFAKETPSPDTALNAHRAAVDFVTSFRKPTKTE